MESTEEITLTSGGRAWVWRELLWTDDFRRAFLVTSREPRRMAEKLREERQRQLDAAQGVQPGADPEIALTDDDHIEMAAQSVYAAQQELAISLERWENVRDPRTGEQLRFPEDLARLSKRDGDELQFKARQVLAKGAPDPNAIGGPSPIAPATAVVTPRPIGRQPSKRHG